MDEAKEAISARTFVFGGVREMSASAIEQKALSLLRTFENAGKSVSRITIEGKKIELVLATEQTPDEYAGIDMRYDKA